MKRILSGVAAVAMAAGGLALVGVASVGAATTYTPTITVSPNTGLTNGETVTITGSGFMPSEASLIAVECIATATSATGCNTTTIRPGNGIARAATSRRRRSSSRPAPSERDLRHERRRRHLRHLGRLDRHRCGRGLRLDWLCDGTERLGVAVDRSHERRDRRRSPERASRRAIRSIAVECSLNATSEAGCDTATATPITVSATGTLPATTFKVATGAIGNGHVRHQRRELRRLHHRSREHRRAPIAGSRRFDFVAPAVTTPPAPIATRVSGTAVHREVRRRRRHRQELHRGRRRSPAGLGANVAVTERLEGAHSGEDHRVRHAKKGTYTL